MFIGVNCFTNLIFDILFVCLCPGLVEISRDKGGQKINSAPLFKKSGAE
jgi:hypothetical protein